MIDFQQERRIRWVLRRLARQRVALILQPGDAWVIENALGDGEGTEEALRTCHLRGWVEVLKNAVPIGQLTSEGKLPDLRQLKSGPIYRLTDAGWSALHRTHSWVVGTFMIALATLVITIVALLK